MKKTPEIFKKKSEDQKKQIKNTETNKKNKKCTKRL